VKIRLNDVRLAFPELWVPKQVQGEGKAAFSATFILVPNSENTQAVEKAMLAAAMERWKADAPAVLKDLEGKGRVCLQRKPRTDKSGQPYMGFEGSWSVAARSEVKPKVIDKNRVDLTQADGRIYGGCYVNAVIDIWAQEHRQYGRRVNAALKGVQFMRDGDAFTGGVPASTDDFEDLSEGVDVLL